MIDLILPTILPTTKMSCMLNHVLFTANGAFDIFYRASVCLSVRPSVTFRYHMKTA